MSKSEKPFKGTLQPTVPRVPHHIRHGNPPGPGAYEYRTSIGNPEKLSPRRSEVWFSAYLLASLHHLSSKKRWLR